MRSACIAILVGSLVLSGCGLTYMVDRDVLLNIALEHKVGLFDAENDVSIAVDAREAIQNEIRESRRDIEYAEAQIAEAISDGERAAQKGEWDKVELADLAGEVFELKIDFLEEHIDYLYEKRGLQDLIIVVANAKFELEKAKLVKKINVRGSESVDLEDFEWQVDDKVESARAAQEDLMVTGQEVEEVKQLWVDRRDQLSQKSGGGIGSPWAEDGGMWGIK